MAQRSLSELDRDQVAVREVAASYEGFKKSKDGGAAVGGARHEMALKSATVSASAVRQGKNESERWLASPATAPARPFSRVRPGSEMATDTAKRISESTDKNQFVAGKNFFQNGNAWIDAEAQKMPDSKRIRVQFNSKEYFDLAKNRKALPWLALGSNIQFVLDGKVYEIYE
jgi:hypothetical protein